MDDEDSQEGEENAEAELMEAAECVLWPDDIVLVGVEKFAVLLEDSLVWMCLGPSGAALRCIGCGGLCCARGT